MAKPISRWRQIARATIQQVIDGLPWTVSDKDLRKAIRAAYPFGRREHHPYKCWLKEVSLVMRKRVGHDHDYSMRTNLFMSTFRLVVICGMCDGRISGGCLQCVGLMTKVREIAESAEWRAFHDQFRDDAEFALLAANDWLQERGIDAEVI